MRSGAFGYRWKGQRDLGLRVLGSRYKVGLVEETRKIEVGTCP